MKKHSIKIDGHATSISLEDPFWHELRTLAAAQSETLSTLIARIDKGRGTNNLSSALRVYVLEEVRRKNQPVTEAPPRQMYEHE